MSSDREPTKQQFQLRGLADAWLPTPRRYASELRTLARQLADDETLIGIYAMCWDSSTFDGLLALTDQNLRFARFRWFRKPFTHQLARSDIRAAHLSTHDSEVVEVDLADGTSLALRSADPNRPLTPLVEALTGPPTH